MKKNYESPEIAVEFFQMTQTIATCAVKIGFADEDCVLNDSAATSEMKSLAMTGCFSSGIGDNDGCQSPPTGAGTENGVCYHTNVNMAFNS